MNTDQTATTGLPAAMNITSGVTTANALDIRNNLFINTQTLGTERYAIYSGAANTVYSFLDNNDYYTAGPNLGFLTANQANITAWRTATGKDVNSFVAHPFFTSATDFHMITNSNCGIDDKGTPITGITTDIEGNTRNTTTPDPGAYEFTGITVTAPTAPSQEACFGGTIPDLAAIVVGTAKWYSDAALTTLVYTGTPFATGQTAVGAYTYYVVDSIAGTCISSPTTVTLTINDVPAQPSAISGNITVLIGSSQNYSVIDVPGVTYTWTFPTGWTQTGGGTTNSITVTVGSGNGDVTCTPSNTCGVGTPSTLAVTVQDGIPGYTNNYSISVNPNPTSDLITITLNGFSNNINLQLQNVQGKTIYTTDFAAESASFAKILDLSTYQKGIYFLRITSKGNTTVNKIVLQ
jgi:hypothetical protein